MRTVLFICTGNTCRSPMAEAIARESLRSRAEGDSDRDSDGLFVASAGLHAVDGAPVATDAISALGRLGIQHSGSAKRLTAEMVRRADLVFGMTEAHVEAARQLVAGDVGGDADVDFAKVQPIDPREDIEDPIGLGADAYDSVAKRLLDLIPRRLAEVLTP